MKEKTDNELYVSIEERDLISEFLFGEGYTGIFSRIITWNNLMPVVEKIMVICVTRSDLKYSEFKKVLDSKVTTSIEILYKRVVAFIKWYNQQDNENR